MFSTEALERGIKDIEKNIKVFEDQIAKERQRIVEYQDMIKMLNHKKEEAAIAKALEKQLGERNNGH
jgi:hypothetical protein